MGHYYFEDLSKYLKLHIIKLNTCDDCNIAKMKRLPHNKQPPRVKRILEAIHSDIIDPINDSITNKRFIITFIDEFSRKSWLFLIRSKSEAPDIIINFLKQLNNIIGNYKIRYFKSDTGREYDNKKVKNFCKDNGIEKIYSPPYNPENNGLAERYNQTIISSTKTILFWTKLSDNFWDFAIQYSNYIYNKIPHSGIGNKIPDEVFYNKKANINHIKVFGCVTYYKNFEQNKQKFQPNSNKGIFLGFSEKRNSYIIMDFEDFKIHHVREIYCEEDEPANISIANKGSNSDLYPSFFEFNFNFNKSYENNKNNKNFNEDSDPNINENNTTNNENISVKINKPESTMIEINKNKNFKNKNASNNQEMQNTNEDPHKNDENNNFLNQKREKNFINKNLNDFEQKISNNSNNNNLNDIQISNILQSTDNILQNESIVY